jgi:hypothetical protein
MDENREAFGERAAEGACPFLCHAAACLLRRLIPQATDDQRADAATAAKRLAAEAGHGSRNVFAHALSVAALSLSCALIEEETTRPKGSVRIIESLTAGLASVTKVIEDGSNNLRYSVLQTLQRYMHVKEVRMAVADALPLWTCMEDADGSIREVATSLLASIVSKSNAKETASRLAEWPSKVAAAAPGEERRIIELAVTLTQRHAPSTEDEITETVSILAKSKGAPVSHDVGKRVVQLIVAAPINVQGAALRQLFTAAKEEVERMDGKPFCQLAGPPRPSVLFLTAVWIFGELADMVDGQGVSSIEVVKMLRHVLELRASSWEECEADRIVVAIGKIAGKCASGRPTALEALNAITQDPKLTDLAPIAGEHVRLIDDDAFVKTVLARLPVNPNVKAKQEKRDLMPGVPPVAPAEPNLLDFDMGPAPEPAKAPSTAVATDDLLDLFDPAPRPPAAPAVGAGRVGLEHEGLRVRFQHAGDNPMRVTVTSDLTGGPTTSVSNYVFEVMLPKYLKLTMEPASGDSLQSGGPAVTQVCQVARISEGPVVLRFRCKYVFQGTPKTTPTTDFTI